MRPIVDLLYNGNPYNQPSDTADQRGDFSFPNAQGFKIITADNAVDAINYLNGIGQRNTSYYAGAADASLAGPGNGTFTITNVSSGLVMEGQGDVTSQGAPIDQWTSNSGGNQQWQLTLNTVSGFYQLVAANSGLCLDVFQGSTQTGGTLDQWPCSGAANQMFMIRPDGSGNYTITSQADGLVVEDPNSSSTPGTLLDQWTPNQGANQKWVFARIN